jgi:hydrogenase maturation protease
MTLERQESPAGILVIGYGNTLRRDDGVGPSVADAIAALAPPGVRALACPLLTPELADPISRASVVIFVDAAVDAPREVQMRKLAPADTSQIMAHAASPATLLALARDVFGHAPEAWLLTIPAEHQHWRGTLRLYPSRSRIRRGANQAPRERRTFARLPPLNPMAGLPVNSGLRTSAFGIRTWSELFPTRAYASPAFPRAAR